MKTTILLEIDLEKDVPNLLAHIENRASTLSGVRRVRGKFFLQSMDQYIEELNQAHEWRMHQKRMARPWYRRLLRLA